MEKRGARKRKGNRRRGGGAVEEAVRVVGSAGSAGAAGSAGFEFYSITQHSSTVDSSEYQESSPAFCSSHSYSAPTP